jgi:hypothetical protein
MRARFDRRYRLVLPDRAGGYVVDEGQGRLVGVDVRMEWVRPETALTLANRVARRYPDVPFTIEVCNAAGAARWRWVTIWRSPAAESKQHTLWGRLAAAARSFVAAGEKQ